MRIAVLALQGAFIEHRQMLERLGVESFEVRQLRDWQQPKDGQLYDPIREAIQEGLPTFGTCAGLILLDQQHLGTMDIDARRNAYGRQLGSFHTEAAFRGFGHPVPMTFIRAPYINKIGDGVEVLAKVDGRIVAARQGRQLVTAFHPELDEDLSVHRLFLDAV